eukprot:2365060-Rhodomonas_salina.1
MPGMGRREERGEERRRRREGRKQDQTCCALPAHRFCSRKRSAAKRVEEERLIEGNAARWEDQ